MKTKILGLRTTIYKVNDLKAASEWYAKAFLTQPSFDEPFYVGFTIAGYELGLLPDDMPAEKKSGNVLSYWGVDDIDQEFKRFLSLGAKESTPPTNVGGDIIVAEVIDPWGNLIGLIYNPDFKLD